MLNPYWEPRGGNVLSSLGAYWRRPKSYFLATVRRSKAAFNLLKEQLLDDGLSRLRRDLDSGAWEIGMGIGESSLNGISVIES